MANQVTPKNFVYEIGALSVGEYGDCLIPPTGTKPETISKMAARLARMTGVNVAVTDNGVISFGQNESDLEGSTVFVELWSPKWDKSQNCQVHWAKCDCGRVLNHTFPWCVCSE